MSGIDRRSCLGLPRPTATGPARSGQHRWRTTPSREVLRQRYFPNVLLTTHQGEKVRFYDDLMKNKIVIVNFMYATCESACPLMTANLARVHKLLGDRMGRDVFLYSITLRPEVDHPDVLSRYAEMHGAGQGWLMLTGRPSDIELLRRRLGFRNPDPKLDRDTTQHTSMIWYGNEPYQWWARCPGVARPEWIARSIASVDWPRNR
jgi:protein SCO1/2